MKLLSVKQARSIWFVKLVDLNPRGHNLLAIIPGIIEKYKFQIFPIKPDELDLSKGVKFLVGTFQKDHKNIAIDLTVFNDGLVADTRSSTEDSDAFLNDYLTLLSTELDLVPYQEVLRSNAYLSELWVQTDKSLNALNPKLADFAKRLTSLVVGHSHHHIAFESTGITFWTDPIVVNPPGPFKFERAENTPFGESRYYSAAPLQTNVHLEMLTELESILSS
jgi:hypothetical protein